MKQTIVNDQHGEYGFTSFHLYEELYGTSVDFGQAESVNEIDGNTESAVMTEVVEIRATALQALLTHSMRTARSATFELCTTSSSSATATYHLA
jgi:hypothetical protein